jgi:hypothetical protein
MALANSFFRPLPYIAVQIAMNQLETEALVQNAMMGTNK